MCAQSAGFVNDPFDLLERELAALFMTCGVHSQPAMKTVVVTTIRQVNGSLERKTKINKCFRHDHTVGVVVTQV